MESKLRDTHELIQEIYDWCKEGKVVKAQVRELIQVNARLALDNLESLLTPTAPDPADLAACQRDMDEMNYRLAAEEDAKPQGR